MNVKQWIINTNNAICYVIIAVVLIVGVLAILGGSTVGGVIFILTAWPVCTFICGYWIVLSKIAENTSKQVELLEALVERS